MTEKKEEKTKKSILRDQRIFVRLTTEEFLELKTRASSNHRKVSEFVRETVFADKWVKLNDDWHLYDAIRSTNNDLNRLGNYYNHKGKQVCVIDIRNVRTSDYFAISFSIKKIKEIDNSLGNTILKLSNLRVEFV